MIELFIKLLILIFIFCVYMLIRIEWVYRKRIGILRKDRESYLSLPNWNEMLYRWFFVWDFSWFIKLGKYRNDTH